MEKKENNCRGFSMIRLLLLVVLLSELGDGSSEVDGQSMTALQRHVAFFDRDGDGIVYPWETFQGFRVLGFNCITSCMAMIAINGALSYQTLATWIPSPTLQIYVKNIYKAKHGSDSDIYDHEGRLDEARFEELFTRFASTRRDRMSLNEILNMTTSNQEPMDFFGWTAAKLEWGAAFMLVKDEEGYVSKDSIKGILNGSLFYELEGRQHK